MSKTIFPITIAIFCIALTGCATNHDYNIKKLNNTGSTTQLINPNSYSNENPIYNHGSLTHYVPEQQRHLPPPQYLKPDNISSAEFDYWQQQQKHRHKHP